MKKILSLILAACLLLIPIATLSACGGGNDGGAESGSGTESGTETESGAAVEDEKPIDLETISADPYGTMSAALQKAFALFFADDAGLFGTVSDTMKNGSVAASFAHRTLMGDIKRINETLYIDSSARKYVSKTQVLLDKKLLSAHLFFDREGLSFKSQAVLGSDKTLEINLADFAASFSDSAAAELSGLSAEMVSMIANGAALFGECYRALFEANAEEAKAMLLRIGEIFAQRIKQTDTGFLVSYHIDNDALNALIEYLAAQFDGTEGDAAPIVEMATQFLQDYSAEMRAEFMIDAQSGAAQSILLQGLVETTENQSVGVNLLWRRSEAQMKLNGTFSMNDQSFSADLTLDKAVESGLTSYKMALDTTYNGSTNHLADAQYVYDLGGGVKVTATLYVEGEEPMDLTLLGQITVGEADATIAFSSLQYKNVKALFDATLIFTPNVPLPEKPEETMDVVQMTEADWHTVLEELRGSVIGELLLGEKEPSDAEADTSEIK